MQIQFEVHSQNSTSLAEVFEFWKREWDKAFQTLIGKEADITIFNEYEYFYVLRFDGKIGVIMSSTSQKLNPRLKEDHYYESWPQAFDYLESQKVFSFHKMGMIAMDTSVCPRGFKATRVIIGCGLMFTNTLSNCQGVVSFPRSDTSVYTSCVEWGARTPKEGIIMYNVPVNFILLLHAELRANHQNKEIDDIVKKLWNDRVENISTAVAS